MERSKMVVEHSVESGKIDDTYKIDMGKDGIISSGSLGILFKATHLKTNVTRAVKQIKKQTIKAGKWKQERVADSRDMC